ncbi:hypothetical protein BDV18DRAFT_138579 [Aspergillus unguis]
MTGGDSCHLPTLPERVGRLVNDAFNLSLFHKCKVYVLVEHSDGVRTFKSVEQSSWPPPDYRLGEIYPRIERLYSHHLVRTRLTEEQRKFLIQLSLYFLRLTDFWPDPGLQAHTDSGENDIYQTPKHGED